MEKKNKSLLALSFSKGFTSPNIPIITISQGNRELNFILDTGSDRNIIDSNILPLLEHTQHKGGESIALTGVGGTKKVQICSITFQIKEESYTADFLVSDMKDAFSAVKEASAVHLHGILGSEFLRSNKIVLDFSSMVAYNDKK
jgi:hypothetical protein